MPFHARRFDRSARGYEARAGVQRRMAESLVDLWTGPDPGKVLEFGCGTGILTRVLRRRFPSAFILATDAAPAMLAEARERLEPSPNLKFALQDASGTSQASSEVNTISPFKFVCSSALVQWFPDLGSHLRFVSGLTQSGGAYLVSGFARSNFPELNSLLREPPFVYRNFPGHEPEGLRGVAESSGWEVSALRFWEEREFFPSAREVLRHIQVLGSSRDPGEGGRLNRRSLEYLVSAYARRFSGDGGVRLTWKPWTVWLRKPS